MNKKNTRNGIEDIKRRFKDFEKYMLKYQDISRLLSPIEDYVNNKSILKFKCNCGNIFTQSVVCYKLGTKMCEKCVKENISKQRRLTKEDIYKIIDMLNKNTCMEYKWTHGEYKNSKSNIVLEDNLGYRYKFFPSYFIENYKKYKKINKLEKWKTTSEFTIDNIKLWLSYNAIGFELIDNVYVDAKSKLKLKCQDGHEFYVSIDKLNSGQRCQLCEMSSGEKIIYNWLKYYNVDFQIEYSFPDCKYKNKLYFDFAIFENNKIKMLIEYDGEYHYEVGRHSGKDKMLKKFKEGKKRDEIKNKYCEENNLKLFRIPYWEKENINNILSKLILTI